MPVPPVQRLRPHIGCFLVHSFAAALRGEIPPRKLPFLSACRNAGFAAGGGRNPKTASSSMNDRPVNGSAAPEAPFSDIESATRRLTAALAALESAVERGRDADRDEDELATRIHALVTDLSRLADELDSSLVK